MRFTLFFLCFILFSVILCVQSSKNYTYYVEWETSVNPPSGNTFGFDYFISTVNNNSGFTEAPPLTLVGGNSYTFCLANSNTSLYFQICETADCGASLNNTVNHFSSHFNATTNVTTTTDVFQKGLHKTGDCFTWIPPIVTQPTTGYYYGDYLHPFMGNSITLIPASICDRNSQRIYGTTNANYEVTLIEYLVLGFWYGNPSAYSNNINNAVVGAFPGAFNNQSVLGNYFNGTYAASYRNGTHVDFVTSGTAQTTLYHQLTTYFGNAMGCTGDDLTSFPPYVGTLPNLNLIHQGLPINQAAFDMYVLTWLKVLDGYNFTVADQQWFSDFLDQFRFYCDDTNPNLICNQPDCLVAAVPSAQFDCIALLNQASSSSNYYYDVMLGLSIGGSLIIAFLLWWIARKQGTGYIRGTRIN
jgi:hypothetical protein